MRIDGLNVYNQYNGIETNRLKDDQKRAENLSSTKSLSQDANELKSNYLNNINPNKIITKQERQYFKNMFPESSDLIEKHVLFNRNAKIQSPNISKGQLIDGVV
jgi:hypothetical protein